MLERIKKSYRSEVQHSQIMSITCFAAPEGCLQYFTDRMGTVSSFNWDGTATAQYVRGQHYAVCFKRSPSDCSLSLSRSKSAPAFSTSVGRATGAPKNSNNGNNNNPVTNDNIYDNQNCGPDNGMT